jgi:2-keto-4-pentenoate hydratase/2-oxohepta-3-ene-1,7-dioic acid hydratase in catechol pathway
VVLADAGRHVPADEALARGVLGFMCAQDISERHVQFAAGAQFSMGKSYPTFCPTGPAIVTLDELPDPTSLSVQCTLNGATMQHGTTSDLIFDVAALLAFISSICPLRAGDLCLTGTPAGVGVARTPPVFLQPGDQLVTTIDELGTMSHRCVAEGP